MIILVTGSPGGGKSLYTVSTLVPQWLAEGRKIYTNIKGLTYSEWIIEDGKPVQRNLVPIKDGLLASEVVHELPDDFDWRDTPEGSVVIYDEAQKFFPTRGGTGLSSDGRISDLDTHRHKGYDIVFITQHPTLIDSHIRKFVGKHYHLYRKHGASMSSLYTWDQCNNAPEREIGEDQPASKELFKFDKEAFRFYKSSEIHTHKFRIPKKAFYIAGALGLLVAVIGGIAYKVYTSVRQSIDNYKEDIVIEPPPSSQRPDFVLGSSGSPRSFEPQHRYQYTAELKSIEYTISGCASFANKCECYDGRGYPIDMPVGQCKSIVDGRLPQKIGVGQTSPDSFGLSIPPSISGE